MAGRWKSEPSLPAARADFRPALAPTRLANAATPATPVAAAGAAGAWAASDGMAARFSWGQGPGACRGDGASTGGRVGEQLATACGLLSASARGIFTIQRRSLAGRAAAAYKSHGRPPGAVLRGSAPSAAGRLLMYKKTVAIDSGGQRRGAGECAHGERQRQRRELSCAPAARASAGCDLRALRDPQQP